jgi:hypothetical protein
VQEDGHREKGWQETQEHAAIPGQEATLQLM